MMFTVFSTTAIYRLLNLDAYDAYTYIVIKSYKYLNNLCYIYINMFITQHIAYNLIIGK